MVSLEVQTERMLSSQETRSEVTTKVGPIQYSVLGYRAGGWSFSYKLGLWLNSIMALPWPYKMCVCVGRFH